jgi:hypothetical protein
MKKFILLSLLTILFTGLFAGSAFAMEMKPVSSCPAGIWIKILVTFHKPKHDCKTGFGICFETTWGIEAPSTGGQMCLVRAQINGQNQLILEVTEEALASYEGGSTLPNFKNRNSITLDDPFTLSAATSKALGSPTPVTIKAGTYPLSNVNHTYTVTIPL